MAGSSVGLLNGILCSRLARYTVRWVYLTAWDFLLWFCEKKDYFFRAQEKEFLLVLWASSSYILPAQGHQLLSHLILVNNRKIYLSRTAKQEFFGALLVSKSLQLRTWIFPSQPEQVLILAVAVGQEVWVNMWVYLGDLIDENHSHNR